MKTQILRRFTSAVLAAVLCFSSLSTPVYAQETAAADSFSGPVQELPADTEEPPAEASDPESDAGQAFVDAVNALDRMPSSRHPMPGALPARRGRPTPKTRS